MGALGVRATVATLAAFAACVGISLEDRQAAPSARSAAVDLLELDKALLDLLRQVEVCEGNERRTALYNLRDYLHGRPPWERPTQPIRDVVARHAMTSESAEFRRVAFEILYYLDDPSLLPLLTAGLRDEEVSVRMEAAEAIARVGREYRAVETADALREMLDDKYGGHTAVIALSKLLQDRATPILLNEWRAGRLGGQARFMAAYHFAEYPHVDAVQEMLTQLDPETYRAADAFSLPNPTAAALFFENLDQWPLSADVLTEAFADFPRPHEDKDGTDNANRAGDDVRRIAVQYLGDVRDSCATDLLLKAAVSDPSLRVRSASAKALARLGEERAVTVLNSQLDVDDRGRGHEGHVDGALHVAAVDALGVLADVGVPGALSALYDRIDEEAAFTRELWLYWSGIDAKLARQAIPMYQDRPLPNAIAARWFELITRANMEAFAVSAERYEKLTQSFGAWLQRQPEKAAPEKAKWVERGLALFEIEGAIVVLRAVRLTYPAAPDRFGSGHTEVYLFLDGSWRDLGTTGHWVE